MSNRVYPNDEYGLYNRKKKVVPPEKISSLSLLATSLKVQTREFFDNSTLHGVRYIAEKDRPFCERFMWFVFTSIGAVSTCIIILSLWEKFQTNPTITGLDTDFHNWDVPFPAVTICDRNPTDLSLMNAFIQKTWGDNQPEKAEQMLTWLTTLSYSTLVESYKEYTGDESLTGAVGDLRDAVWSIVNRCDSMFYDCKWKADVELCCEVLFPTFTELGYCYAFNSKHSERKWPWQEEELEEFTEEFIHETDAKWSFGFNSLMNESILDVYIHSTDEMTGVGASPQHSWTRLIKKISFSVKQTYTTEDARQLSIKQRRCVFSDEIKLDTSSIYTYTACMRQCRMQRARSLCGCVPHFYPHIDGYRWCTLKELACIAMHAEEIVDMNKCNCELGCSHTVYEVEKLTEAESNTENEETIPLETEFVSWPMVRYKREVLFGWVDLLVSFGGIAGLFLGFSLLSGVEIIYYFSIRACCAACCTSRDELIAEKMKKPEKPPYDLSLTPWWKQPPLPRNKMALNEPLRINVKTISTSRREMAPPKYSPPPLYKYLP